ncbi:MAG: DUF3658 domain-containing protein [Methylococcales bacterium]
MLDFEDSNTLMGEEEQEEYSMSEDEIKIVNFLSEEDRDKIDQWLLKNISSNWQKVAMVVAKAIEESDQNDELTDVPDIYFGMRVEELVKKGKIISQGNLKKMRFSEVKNVSS